MTEESVIRKIRITANDGKNYNTNFYSLDAIEQVNEEYGKISRKQAEEKAGKEYDEFNKNQKIVSDFDKLIIEANRLNYNNI